MADISDVFRALSSIIATVVYPNGPTNPSSIIVGGVHIDVKIFAGWPLPQNLDNDVAAGIADISIYAPRAHWKNTTRYPRNEMQLTAPVKTITATVNAAQTQVTIGGTLSLPQNVAIVVNGTGVSYGCQSGDTPSLIAAGIVALLIAAGVGAANIGPAITITNPTNLSARVGGAGTTIREVMRQEQMFQISFWCPSAAAGQVPDAIRSALAAPVKVALSVLSFLTLADGSAARIITAGDYLSDDVSKPNVYRRDIMYQIEYPTTQTQIETEIVLAKIDLSGGLDLTGPLIDTYVY